MFRTRSSVKGDDHFQNENRTTSWRGRRIVVNVIGSVTTGRCTVHVTEAHALASTVEELEECLEVQDVEDLEELSESMWEGLATIRHTHTVERENQESWLRLHEEQDRGKARRDQKECL